MKSSVGVLLAFLCFASEAFAGLKIYYIRHAESGANVAKAWEQIPQDQRPSYVGNEDAFSPLGEAQVKVVRDKLAPYRFDFIAVSPKWRSRQTILGYLQMNGRKAEIWPELEEFGFDTKRLEELPATDSLQPPRPDLLVGDDVKIAESEKPFFTIRDDGKRRFKLRTSTEEKVEDCVNLLRSAITRIKQHNPGRDSSVLLVGHGNSGRLLLHLLVGKEGSLPAIDNIGIWMAEEQPDGSFALKKYNDKPVEQLTGPARVMTRDRLAISP